MGNKLYWECEECGEITYEYDVKFDLNHMERCPNCNTVYGGEPRESGKEKITKLKTLNKKGYTTSKWKEVAIWNREHSESLDDFVMIAGKIRNQLKELGWNKYDLSNESDIPIEVITNILKGRENLTLLMLRKIENVLNIKLIKLI